MDRTTYVAGDTVYMTIISQLQGSGYEFVVIAPSDWGPELPSHWDTVATAFEQIPVNGPGTYPVALKLPSNVPAGMYNVGLVFPEAGGDGLDPIIQITVSNQTTETPSVLALLIPALLVGLFVLRRKKVIDT